MMKDQKIENIIKYEVIHIYIKKKRWKFLNYKIMII
jgi:hypothetical protein